MSSGIKDEYFAGMEKAVEELSGVKERMGGQSTGSDLISRATREHYEGKIIVLEGLDRTGKSTQLEVLKAEFEKAGAKVLAVHFPSGSTVGDVIYKELNEHRKEMLEIEIWINHLCAHFAITRERIIPALKEGYVVIADRWVTSAIVYNGMTAKCYDAHDLAQLEHRSTRELSPEAFFYFKSYEDQLKSPFLVSASDSYERFFSGSKLKGSETFSQRVSGLYPKSKVYKMDAWRDRGQEATSIDIFARLGQLAVEKSRAGI